MYMPQLAPITVNDGSKDRNFTPKGITANVAELVELNASGVALARPRLTCKVSTTSTGRSKVELKLAVPVVQDAIVGGVSRPQIVRTGYADITFTSDGASTFDERHALRYLVGNLLTGAGSAPIHYAVDDATGLY
ncbi:MAG: coat protein [Fushun levivirus 5]|uniref:Coat protein n=1 Tax=Fushun levivirus 5 TaxID=2905461 RepID=A0A8K1XY50_9VIRU|nr:MAG: coat protein [Fushun levivirus 5]